MASQTAVERTVRDLIRRLDEADSESKVGLPENRTIACVVTDHGTTYVAELREGSFDGIQCVAGAGTGDVTFRVKSDDLIALSDGRLNLAFAVMTGKLKVNAAPRDFALLRRLF